MKNASLLLLTIGLTALMHSYAASSPLSRQASAEPAAEPVSNQAAQASQDSPADSAKGQKNVNAVNTRASSREALKRNLVPTHPDLSKTKRLPVPGSERRSRPSTAIIALQPGSAVSRIGGRRPIQTGTATSVPLLSSVSRPTSVPVTSVHHRNSNAAIISGAVHSNAGHGTVLNGSDIRRRR